MTVRSYVHPLWLLLKEHNTKLSVKHYLIVKVRQQLSFLQVASLGVVRGAGRILSQREAGVKEIHENNSSFIERDIVTLSALYQVRAPARVLDRP